jgi:hypothetical protein
MTAEDEKLKNILERIKASGKLDEEDLKDLTYSEKDLIQTLFDEGLIEKSLIILTDLNAGKDLQIIKRKLIDSERTIFKQMKPLLKYAAIFIALFASVYYFQMKEVSETKFQVAEDYIRLKMGGDRIQLINQAGEYKILSTSGEIIGKQEGSSICYMADSQIDKLIYNELRIPNGKIFNLELSDGTVVHLNSGTTIKYPVKFLKGMKREVFVDGDAYFDVTKDVDHPFIVNADDVIVTVLGTKFNVSSYREDSEITTVLIEGSVHMANTITTENDLILKSGMKGTWHKSERSTNIDIVDADNYIGWIKGELIFKNTTFSTMIKTLERKYNVSIENKANELDEKMLTASFNTHIESIEEVFNVISKIFPFDYQRKGKQILISPKHEQQ